MSAKERWEHLASRDNTSTLHPYSASHIHRHHLHDMIIKREGWSDSETECDCVAAFAAKELSLIVFLSLFLSLPLSVYLSPYV